MRETGCLRCSLPMSLESVLAWTGCLSFACVQIVAIGMLDVATLLFVSSYFQGSV